MATPALSAPSADIEEDLYYVELVVFERTGEAYSKNAEQWPKNLKLQYPPHWKKLIDPVLEAELKRQAEQEKNQWALDNALLEGLSLMSQTSGEPSPVTGENSTDVSRERPDQRNQSQTDASTAQAPNNGENLADAGPSEVTLPKFLEFAPSEEHELRESSRAINRDRTLRVLFHERWLQALKDQPEAPALILRGGNQFGDHYELEGFITLHLRRYLHITTDLWLTQFVPNRGQQSDHWPSLPDLPTPESQLLAQLTSDIDLSMIDLAPQQDPALTFSEEERAAGNDYLQATGTGQNSPQATAPLSATGKNSGAWPAEPGAFSASSTDEAIVEAPAPYLINQIVTLKQSRRMRSEETHYLDHPKLGVLIRFQPYEPEELTDETAIDTD